MKSKLPSHIDTTGLTPGERLRVVTRWFFSHNRMLLVIIGLFATWIGLSTLVLYFEQDAAGSKINTIGNALWWGIVTFMTVGYGDFVPITWPGRIVAGFLMFAGVTCIGIISARISAYFVAQVLFEGRGSVDKSKVRNHFIVCGWKEDMQDLLRHMLIVNRNLRAQDIIVVANKMQEQITALKSDPKLGGVTVIIGDYFQQTTLERAAPEAARKILILADSSAGADGRKISATEADARTIMTAIALSNIAKGTEVAAEIIDASLDHYLKMAGVAEIIYTREYNRMLLGSASGGTGIVNVFHDLVNPSSGAFLTTQPIAERFIEQSYGMFRIDFEKRHRDMLLIGVLENTGNPHSIKELAFKEAQKTPSIGRLIENLKSAKTLRCNSPMFHPREDYRINKGSAAIVLVNHHAADSRDDQNDGSAKDNVAA